MRSEYYRALMERNWDAMPVFMQNFHGEMLEKTRPSTQLLKKYLVKEWIFFFDKNSFNERDIASSVFHQFTKKGLDVAGNWTADNFALLDLGGNMAWYLAFRKVAGLADRKKWDEAAEERLVLKHFLHETRWADEL